MGDGDENSGRGILGHVRGGKRVGVDATSTAGWRRKRVIPAIEDVHTFLTVSTLTGDYSNVPVENYSKEAMSRILANTAEGVVRFAEECVQKEWFKSNIFVGSLADDADEITAEAGWPAASGRGALTNAPAAKRNAWRLVSFIYLMQKYMEKDMSDVEWAGSPAVPEQLLAAAQAALVAKGMENWACPLKFPIVDLIARVVKLASTADNIMLDVSDSPEQMQPKVKAMHDEKVAIRRSIRAFNVGTWNSVCQAARTTDLLISNIHLLSRNLAT